MTDASAHIPDDASIVQDAILCAPLGDSRIYRSKMDDLVVHRVSM